MLHAFSDGSSYPARAAGPSLGFRLPQCGRRPLSLKACGNGLRNASMVLNAWGSSAMFSFQQGEIGVS